MIFKHRYRMELFLGKPGCGKTTKMASIVKKNDMKKRLIRYVPILKYFIYTYKKIYCTDPDIKNTIYMDYKYLGHFEPEADCCFLLCESGVGLSNRNTMKADPKFHEFAAMYRHDKCDVFLDSQTVDVDIKFRQRCDCVWLLKKSILNPNNTVMQKVYFDMDVNDEQKAICESYTVPRGLLAKTFSWLTGGRKTLKRKKYYSYFDTYSKCQRIFDYKEVDGKFIKVS